MFIRFLLANIILFGCTFLIYIIAYFHAKHIWKKNKGKQIEPNNPVQAFYFYLQRRKAKKMLRKKEEISLISIID